jgi:signal transduction histidine kinase
MEAIRLFDNMRSPLHAIIDLSESISSEKCGPIARRYRSHATDIRVSALQILVMLNETLDTPSSNPSGISFESNTTITDLLMKIIGSAKVMREQIIGPLEDRYREDAKRIHGNADALLDSVNSIRELTGIESEKIETIREEEVDIDQMVQTNLRWIEQFAIQKDIEIVWLPKPNARRCFVIEWVYVRCCCPL